MFFLFAFGFCAFNGGFALFAERRFDAFTAGEVGGVFAFAGMVGLVFQLGLTAKLIARFGERAVTLGGFLIAGIGYAALGQSYAVPAMLAAVALSASGNVLLRPALTTLISRQAGKARQGAAMGSVQAMQSAAQVVAPLGSGWLIGGGGLVGWSLMAAGALAAGFAASWRWARCEA